MFGRTRARGHHRSPSVPLHLPQSVRMTYAHLNVNKSQTFAKLCNLAAFLVVVVVVLTSGLRRTGHVQNIRTTEINGRPSHSHSRFLSHKSACILPLSIFLVTVASTILQQMDRLRTHNARTPHSLSFVSCFLDFVSCFLDHGLKLFSIIRLK